MTAIVMNTLTGAVTEYDWAHHGVSPSRVASDDGLFTIGGATDDGVQIEGSFATHVAPQKTSLREALDALYFTMTGTEGSVGVATVSTPFDTYEYEFAVRARGVSRAKPGRGIKENKLGFGFHNLDGAFFEITMLEAADLPSTQRRI